VTQPKISPEKKEKMQLSEMEEHLTYRIYVRDVILGANDGLVSIFALVLGIAGAGFLPRAILLAGVAGTVAGAISMAIGEYLSTKSQEEVYDSEMELEKEHIKYHLDHEIEELYEFYEDKGFEGELLKQIVTKIASDEDVLLKEMMMTEFGVIEEQRRSPIKATIIVGIAFFLGSLPPVVPFIFANSTISGVLIAGFSSVIGLFLVGGLKARVTRGNVIRSGGENLILGLSGAIITFFIGFLIGRVI